MDVHEEKKKTQMGQRAFLLGTHLIELMRRLRFGERPFENLVHCIQGKQPV